MKPHLRVAAGILLDAADQVLIAERLADGPFHGMWEFPGGKIDTDESAVDALRRELHEELGIRTEHCEHFINLEHEYDDRKVTIDFFLVASWDTEPVGREGQRLKWVSRERLREESLLPADEPVVDALAGQQILS